jgi:hypothetical protein
MTKLIEKTTGLKVSRLSRRTFLAGMGKITLGVGVLLAGLSWVRTAEAVCCITPATPLCAGCPPDPRNQAQPCPTGCTWLGNSTCCENNNVKTCDSCFCGLAGCVCEYLTGPGAC